MKALKGLVILVISLVLLFGCSTPYKAQGFMGGFSDIQLGENIFRVSFRGNNYTSRERTLDFSLLRAAEICLEKNFRYFAISESSEYEKTGTFSTPMTLNTRAHGDGLGSTTNVYGGETFLISKPITSITVVAFRKKPNINAIVYDAEFISKSIKTRYDIKN